MSTYYLEFFMKIDHETLNELTGLQEDVATSFTDDNLISGETYWTMVESLATAKLAELRGEVISNFA
jgi:hypothetical protein